MSKQIRPNAFDVNFGRRMVLREQPDDDRHYDIADENMEAVYRLWEGSLDDDAVFGNKFNRVFAAPRRSLRATFPDHAQRSVAQHVGTMAERVGWLHPETILSRDVAHSTTIRGPQVTRHPDHIRMLIALMFVVKTSC